MVIRIKFPGIFNSKVIKVVMMKIVEIKDSVEDFSIAYCALRKSEIFWSRLLTTNNHRALFIDLPLLFFKFHYFCPFPFLLLSGSFFIRFFLSSLLQALLSSSSTPNISYHLFIDINV